MSTLLANKLGDIENKAPLWKIKNEEKIIQLITEIKNAFVMKSIVGSLFHTSNLAEVYYLIGRRGQTEITKMCIIMGELTNKYVWEEITKFLEMS